MTAPSQFQGVTPETHNLDEPLAATKKAWSAPRVIQSEEACETNHSAGPGVDGTPGTNLS